MDCPRCGHKAIKSGFDYRYKPPRQRYHCCLKGGCTHSFVEKPDNLENRFKGSSATKQAEEV